MNNTLIIEFNFIHKSHDKIYRKLIILKKILKYKMCMRMISQASVRFV